MSDESLAAEANIPVDVLRAIRQVESGGNPAAIRFEPHVFLRRTSTLRGGNADARRRASPYFDRIPFTPDPERHVSLIRSETDRSALDRARAFDEDQAIRSTSWGTYQVLGGHLLTLFDTNPVDSFFADPINVSDQLLITWFRANPAAAQQAREYNIMALAQSYNGDPRWGRAVAEALRSPRDTTPRGAAHVLEIPETPATPLPVPENDILERISEITSDRTEAPDSNCGYLTLEGSTEDQSALKTLSDDDENTLILARYDRFYNQVVALKATPNIKMSECMPIIEINMEDDGRIVNLNQLVFGTSTFEGYFSEEEFGSNPERPLASIDQFQVHVQPTQYGTTSLSEAELSIKIHNPEMANRDHPRGKYISYMLSQGYTMRIKYGVNGSYDMEENERQALQWKEEDFYVTNYRLTINPDKTANLKLNLMPNTQKLLNHIFIGESIPASSVSELSTTDINDIVSSVVAGDRDASEAQVTEIRRRISVLTERFNSERASVGARTISYGDGTFGSVLHGAVSNSRILENPEGVVAVPVENMVEALQTIQAVLLTQRHNRILSKSCYRHTRNGTSVNVVNLGPLLWEMARPELELALAYASQNNMAVGESFSNDEGAPPKGDGPPPTRNRVKMIFGNFNSQAGQFANSPISLFPINIDSIFAIFRARRTVGEFSCKFNEFCGTAFSQCRESESFSIDRSTDGGSEPVNRIELPEVRYELYKDPTDPTYWIFYVYDNKLSITRFRAAVEAINSSSTSITKEQAINILSEQRVSYFEMGEEGSFLRTFGAETISDDTILSNAIFLANRGGAGVRDLDGSPGATAGIGRDWESGNQFGSNAIYRTQTTFLPMQVSLDSYIIPTAVPFSPVFVFFPFRGFSNIYIIQNITHQVGKNRVLTQMNLIPESSVNSSGLTF